MVVFRNMLILLKGKNIVSGKIILSLKFLFLLSFGATLRGKGIWKTKISQLSSESKFV